MQPTVRSVSGQLVTITRLRFKLLSISEPDYQVAAAAHIHPATLSKYAQGKQPMSAKHLQSLCELFKCQPDEIMGTMEVEIA
jgi:transcriptional regulator with XRE-family HTH domain